MKRDPERTKRVMRSYARNVSTQVSLETIRTDVISNDIESFDKETLYSYLNALKRIFVIEDSPAWNPNLRSKTADGTVYHYRDKTGLECDAVIHLRNGRYGLVEVKLGGDKR